METSSQLNTPLKGNSFFSDRRQSFATPQRSTFSDSNHSTGNGVASHQRVKNGESSTINRNLGSLWNRPVSQLAKSPLRPLVDSPFKSSVLSGDNGSNAEIFGSSQPMEYQNPYSHEQSPSLEKLSVNSIFNRKATLSSNRLSFSEGGGGRVHSSPIKVPIQTLPSGEWETPYVKVALARMINKDLESRKMIFNIIILMSYLILLKFSNLAFYHFDFEVVDLAYDYIVESSFFSYADWLFRLVLAFNIFTSFINLVKPQDKCLDLPLTNKQRRLLNLPLVLNDDDNELEKEQKNSKDFGVLNTTPQVVRSQNDVPNSSNTTLNSEISSRFSKMNLSTPLGNSLLSPLGNRNKDVGSRESYSGLREKLLAANVGSRIASQGQNPLFSSPVSTLHDTSLQGEQNWRGLYRL